MAGKYKSYLDGKKKKKKKKYNTINSKKKKMNYGR